MNEGNVSCPTAGTEPYRCATIDNDYDDDDDESKRQR